jgi:hypothetical protein
MLRQDKKLAAIVCCLLSAFCLSIVAAQEQETPGALELRTVQPESTGQVLFNPGLGLYLAGGSTLRYQPTPDAWVFQMADIIYFRPVWADLEEDGPGSGFDDYFQPIFDFWVEKLGKRVAFRVMSESMHSRREYATPKWVFDQGVPGVPHVGLYAKRQWDPVFWDDKYLELHCQFVQRLGQYLDGRAGLEFIDVGSIGEWGEMHLGLHIPGRWTSEQLAETGFTQDKYIAAYRRVIDAHARAFPRTRVFLNVGNYAHINDYAALRGLHFRQDGLTPRGPSADVGNRFYRPYAPRGVICNYEFHSGLQSMRQKGWDLQATVDQGLDAPISYMNTNILSPARWEDAPNDVKEIFLDAARRIGFRFVLTRLDVQAQLRVRPDRPSRLIVKHRWKNTGIAPCYESYAIEFSLHDAHDNVLARELSFPRVPTTRWTVETPVDLHSVMKIPPGVPAGEYVLKVGMRLPEEKGVAIGLGIAGEDAQGRYRLCDIPAVVAKDGSMTVVEPFEESPVSWSAARGVQLAIDEQEHHSGNSSLRVAGTQDGGWNYAAARRNIRVFPGSKYRLTCRMKVNHLAPTALPPYLKLGIHDAEGDWLANITTNKYDPQGLGQWQQLTATAETPLNAALGQFAVERGSNSQSTRVQMWLDDVRLELLEGP